MRRAFTLMELLVVVSIIALLAGAAVPAFLMIRKQAKTTTCINNLRQIGVGIKSYQGEDRRARTPSHLFARTPSATSGTLPLTTAGLSLEGIPAKAFQCPFDPSRGTDPTMGRAGAVLGWADLHLLHEPGSSYQYETSDSELQDCTTPENELEWFFPYSDSHSPSYAPAKWCGLTKSAQRSDGTWLWSDGKAHQLAHQRINGAIIPSAKFPILHCYYHTAWVGAPTTAATFRTDWAAPPTCAPLSSPSDQNIVDYPKKMLNLSWDLNVFWSRPHWESDL